MLLEHYGMGRGGNADSDGVRFVVLCHYEGAYLKHKDRRVHGDKNFRVDSR